MIERIMYPDESNLTYIKVGLGETGEYDKDEVCITIGNHANHEEQCVYLSLIESRFLRDMMCDWFKDKETQKKNND